MKLEKYINNLERYRKHFYYSLLLVGFDIFVPRHHIFFVWDKIPGFMSLYGLFSSVIIIYGVNAIGRAFLMKREDYYD